VSFFDFYLGLFLSCAVGYGGIRSSRLTGRKHPVMAAFEAVLAITAVLMVSMAVNRHHFLPSGDPERDLGTRPRCDFMHFYSSGLIVREDPSKLFQVETQGRMQQQATGLDIRGSDVDFLPYSYAPFLAFSIVPLTLLPFKTAYFVMTVINVTMLGASLAVLIHGLRLSLEQARLLALAAASTMPVYATLIQGQMTFLALLLLSLFVTDLIHKARYRPGVWASLLLFKPSLAAVPLVSLLVRARRNLLTAIPGTLALMGFSVAIVGPGGIRDYVRLLQQMAGGYFFTARPRGMHNLLALFEHLGLGRALWLASAALVVASALVVVRRAAGSLPWSYASLVLAMLLSAPHLHTHDLSLGVIAFAVAAGAVGEPVPWRAHYLFFLIAMSPNLVLAMFGGVEGPNLPVIPLILLGLFFLTLFLSFRGAR
jgi:hypothetical protein